MNRKVKWIVFGVATVAAVGAGAGIAAGAGGDDTDRAITGKALDRATAAALQSTGGGRVTGTEVNDEESYYEVEVTFPDGGQTDVQLDEHFKVVSSETDHENDD